MASTDNQPHYDPQQYTPQQPPVYSPGQYNQPSRATGSPAGGGSQSGSPLRQGLRAAGTHVLLGLGIMVIAALGMAAYMLSLNLLINPWIIPGVSLAIGIGLSVWQRRRFAQWLRLPQWISIPAWSLLVALVLTTAVLTLNCVGLDEAAYSPRQAEVLQKYTELHHSTRRQGRRTVTNGPTYNSYHIRIELYSPSGGTTTIRNMEIPSKTYKSLRTNDHITIKAATGRFGIPFLTTDIVAPEHPKTNRRSRPNFRRGSRKNTSLGRSQGCFHIK